MSSRFFRRKLSMSSFCSSKCSPYRNWKCMTLRCHSKINRMNWSSNSLLWRIGQWNLILSTMLPVLGMRVWICRVRCPAISSSKITPNKCSRTSNESSLLDLESKNSSKAGIVPEGQRWDWQHRGTVRILRHSISPTRISTHNIRKSKQPFQGWRSCRRTILHLRSAAHASPFLIPIPEKS